MRSRAFPRVTWTDAAGSHEGYVQKKMVVGGAATADLVIDDPAVSRIHAEIDPREDGLWVRDLVSRNGTVIDGARADEGWIRGRGTLQLGTTTIEVDYAKCVTGPVELWRGERFHHLVGRSSSMRELFALIARIARTEASVLINGETGTGKEVVARSLHDASARATQPFVVVDCAALPETLLDAELFGHVRGAYTGAAQTRVGAFESAEGGTVFLDEIGEVPLSMQPKLLRVLEQRTIRRLGESLHRPVDVRFVCATHRDLLSMVSRGEFREDLYFRLSVLPITVPPLRERREDIELLARHFLGDEQLSPEFVEDLQRHPWRGNVRELRNFIDRTLALGEKRVTQLHLRTSFSEDEPPTSRARSLTTIPPAAYRLPLPARTPRAETQKDRGGSDDEILSDATSGNCVVAKPGLAMPSLALEGSFKTFREAWMAHGERAYLEALLHRHGRNANDLAKEADVDRTYIYRLMKKHGL